MCRAAPGVGPYRLGYGRGNGYGNGYLYGYLSRPLVLVLCGSSLKYPW